MGSEISRDTEQGFHPLSPRMRSLSPEGPGGRQRAHRLGPRLQQQIDSGMKGQRMRFPALKDQDEKADSKLCQGAGKDMDAEGHFVICVDPGT